MVDDEISDGSGPKVGDAEEKACTDGVYDPWHRAKPSSFKRLLSRAETPFILIGVSLIVLIVIFFLFVPRNGEDDVGRKLTFLEKRLGSLEDKFGRLEDKFAKIPVAGDAAACERAIDRFESVEASLTMRIGRIAQDLEKLKNDAIRNDKKAVAPVKVDSPAAVQTEKKADATAKVVSVAAVQGKPAYHHVRAGETLFRISRQYNLTVDALRRLNKLTEKDVITPGQKLVVAGTAK